MGAAGAAYYAAGEAGEDSKATKAAAALAAAGAAEMADDNALDYQMVECCSQEQGCCEVSGKIGCVWLEVQFPPGSDIGLACCGMRCMNGNADGREIEGYMRAPEEAPEQHD